MQTKEKCYIDFLQLTHHNLLFSPLPYALDIFFGVKFCTHAKNENIYILSSLFFGKFFVIFGPRFWFGTRFLIILKNLNRNM